MIKLLCFRFHRFVGNKPNVPTASPVALVSPPHDVGFVLERNPDGESVNLDSARLSEVEYCLMVLIEIAPTRDRLEVPDRVRADANGFDPGDVVLKHERTAECASYVQGYPGISVCAADVEEERAIVFEHAGKPLTDLPEPRKIGLTRLAVVVGSVCNPNVVGRRGDDHVYRIRGQSTEFGKAITENDTLLVERAL